MLLRLFCNLPKYLYIAGLVLMLLLVMFSPMFIHAQRENTFYVKGFAGPAARDVGRMTDAAQNSCDPNTSIPCIIIFDPTLAGHAIGTMPDKCAQCVWLDYRTTASATAATVPGIRFADAQAGADDGAKINAAFGSSTNARVFLNDGGGTISTALAIPYAGVLEFGPGVWTFTGAGCTSAINQPGVKIRGTGIGSTVFQLGCATGTLFNVTNQGFELGSLQIRPAAGVTRTAGSIVDGKNVGGYLHDLVIVDPFRGVTLVDDLADNWKITDVALATAGGNWDYFLKVGSVNAGQTAASTTIVNTGGYIRGSVQSAPMFIFDSGVDTINAENVGGDGDGSFPIFQYSDTQARNGYPRWVSCVRCMGEADSGVVFDIQSGRDLNITDSYIGSATNGITVGGLVTFLRISNNHFTTLKREAIKLTNPTSNNIVIQGNSFDTIGYETHNTYSAITIAANVGLFSITGNLMSTQNANQPKYFVDFAAGTSTSWSIDNNASLAGVAGGKYVNVGTITGSAFSLYNNGSDGWYYKNTAGSWNFYNSAMTGIIASISTVTGASAWNGGITVGSSGTPILKHISGTAVLDFAAITAPNCAADLTIPVTNAALGDSVTIGVPNAAQVAGVQFMGWVSGAGTVTVRACAYTGTPNPASATFRADVWQH